LAAADPVCTDPTHDHSHSHDHSSGDGCTDPVCTDPTHDHSHSHDHSSGDGCTDPVCTDPTHDHSHSHDHSSGDEENSTHAGIGTFVYRARRPFHPQRMLSFLRTLPIVRGLPDDPQQTQQEGGAASAAAAAATPLSLLEVPEDSRAVLGATLRSKGFVWCADSHSNSMYWSHAGASFEYKCLGQWWATLPRNQWPEGVDEYVLADFDDVHHPSENYGNDNDTVDDATPLPESVGDRRQEVVFIGLKFGKASNQQCIRETLDKCLLTDDEYEDYRSIISGDCTNGNDEETAAAADPDLLLQNRFPTVMESEYVNY